jgi:hypothetical protein
MAIGVPIGMIMAWPGPQPTIPEGWLLCNGDQVSSHQYPELCDVLQNYWGPASGNPNIYHKLPDLRGVFLRGVNVERADDYKDDDALSRASSFPSAPNEVGSFQLDGLRAHRHVYGYATSKADGVDWKGGGHNHGDFTMVSRPSQTELEGGAETRPKNAYVHWIIKAKD